MKSMFGQVLAALLTFTPLGAMALAPGHGIAPNGTREQEIAQCLPGEIVTWGDGTDHGAIAASMVFSYNPAGAPPWIGNAMVLTALQRATTAWSQCGITAVVNGGTAPVTGPGAVQVIWSDAAGPGFFALADSGRQILILNPGSFVTLRSRNPGAPVASILQMAISHEMGHLYGLGAHSRRCVDVMSYYTDGKGGRCIMRDVTQFQTVPEYRSPLPTACDIQRCRAVNGR